MPVDPDSKVDLGGWTAEELRSTLKQFSGAGEDQEVDLRIRFMRGVARVVRKREAIDTTHDDPKKLSVFLLYPEGGGKEGLAREPMLDSGLTAIAGKVWFVNAPVVSGRAQPIAVDDADAVFRTVTDDLKYGDIPAVVVDPRLPKTEVRFYSNGLNKLDEYEQVRLYCSDLDLQQICEIIDRVYQQCLITPDAQPQGNKLWKDADKHRPFSNAEHKVQAFLKPAFVGAFHTCRVYDEFAGTMGRADLHIQEQDPVDREKVTFLAVLELKVLRSSSEGGKRHSTKINNEWVKKGVLQAGVIRRERGHKVAALCCFDMREKDNGDVCFDSVRGLSEELAVELRRWHLYASSELCRAAWPLRSP